MTRYLPSAALALLSFVLVCGDAAAQCAPDSVPAGATVTCAGTDPDGFDDGSPNLTVNIVAGAVVNGVDGIKVEDDGNTVNVDGTIDVTDDAIVAENDLTVIIGTTGVVEADDKGITADGFDRGLVVNNGSITAVDKAIEINDDTEVRNYGTIESTADEGVELGDNAVVTNAAGATIRGFDDALQVGESATIVNEGLIENTQLPSEVEPAVPGVEAQDAIDIDSGSILNTATGIIRSTTNAAIDYDDSAVALSTITNFGEIAGTIAVETDPANDKAQVIDNFGTITGTSGLALNLGGGNDSYTHQTGASLNGGANFGAGMDTFRFADDFFVFYAADFGGVLDGGDDEDIFDFGSLDSTSVISALLFGEVLTLEIVAFAGTPLSSLMLTSWETLRFADGDFTAGQLSAVPLPAGLVLLAAAFGGLGLMRRARANG